MSRQTQAILQAISDNAARSPESALSMPPAAYHDEELLALESARLFRRDWICMGRLAEMPNPGDYITRDIVGQPVFVIRQRDGSVRAFPNVCLHRAARLLEGSGHVSRISCPYHSWTYEPDGQLIGAPFMQKTEQFRTSDYRLRDIAVDTWEGFVYVTLADNPSPLAESLQSLTALVSDFRMPNYVPVFERYETWDTNWKCLVENFMDSYHLHRVHKDSFAKYGSSEDITLLYPGEDAFTYHVVQENEARFSVYPHETNTWLQGDDRYKTYLINIFPGQVIQLQPDMLWYLSILPRGTSQLSVRWAVSIPAEILDSAPVRQDAIDREMDLIHQVNGEDKVIVENVFEATRSPDAKQGPLCYLERNLWDFSRYLDRRLNAQAAADSSATTSG